MNICAITMVHNEPVNLPIWLRHYGRELGPENLVVVDHQSDDETVALIRTLPQTVRLARRDLDEVGRARFIAGLQRELLGRYDLVLYTDADEMLVADPEAPESLSERLAERSEPAVDAIGLDIWHVHPDEPPIDAARGVLAQRRFARFNKDMCKPVGGSEPLTWSPGFHMCQFPPRPAGDLYLFHLKYMERGLALARLRRSRGFPWSERALQRGHGAHQRRTDEQLIGTYVQIARNVRAGKITPFDFTKEIERIRSGSRLDHRGLWEKPADLLPRLVVVPERFRSVV